MGIYTAPTMSFIDTYTNAAKYRDARTADANKQMMEGIGNLVKSGSDMYKFQQRKNALSKMDELKKREAELMAQIELITEQSATQDYAGSKSNMDAILSGLDWNQLPHTFKMGNGGGLI